MDAARSRRARSFGPVAETFDRVRPGYPVEAVAWLLPGDTGTVVDLGAGTGALTRVLVSLGLGVVAVEPDPQMRQVLARRVPEAEILEGEAESVPLPDASVDAVIGAQMWHWVDRVEAAAEVARVLRPGGTLGLLWNLRDERVPWMAEFGALVRGDDAVDRTRVTRVARALPEHAPFDAVSVRQFPWTQELARGDLVDLAATRSKIRVMEETERAEVLRAVASLSANHPDLTGKPVVEIPYVTTCVRATRSSDAPGEHDALRAR